MPQSQSQSSPEIVDLIDRYASAAREGDSRLIADLFLEDARIRGAIDGAAVDRSAAQFLTFIDESGPSPELKADIAWIDAVGSAAMARVECRDWHGVHYSDFIALIRREEGWRIASKIFFAHERA